MGQIEGEIMNTQEVQAEIHVGSLNKKIKKTIFAVLTIVL